MSSLAGSQDQREAVLKELRALVASPSDRDKEAPPAIAQDLKMADAIIAKAMKKGSWDRNRSWVLKFADYANSACPYLVRELGLRVAFVSNDVPLAFLASIITDQPSQPSRVKAAKRAINFMRSLCGAKPLEDDLNIRLFARAASRSVARTVRQSPGLPLAFARAIAANWGASDVWWKRMVALMVTLGLCTVARGAEVVSCRREGLVWVRSDGTQVRSPYVVPTMAAIQASANSAPAIKGFMVLLPSRKNRQATPTWIPVIANMVISLLIVHVRWIDSLRGPRCGCLFPARVPARRAGKRVYTPSLQPDTAMSVESFRHLLRQALAECCGLSAGQAAEFGTHSLRIGAVELLRNVGVPAEVRQQLGGWMSANSALGYLQLPVSAQFNILNGIFC